MLTVAHFPGRFFTANTHPLLTSLGDFLKKRHIGSELRLSDNGGLGVTIHGKEFKALRLDFHLSNDEETLSMFVEAKHFRCLEDMNCISFDVACTHAYSRVDWEMARPSMEIRAPVGDLDRIRCILSSLIDHWLA